MVHDMSFHTIRRTHTKKWLSALLLATLLLGACGGPKPEDVETWRNAKGGVEKITGWAGDQKVNLPTRERALSTLIQMDLANQLDDLFKKLEGDPNKDQLIKAAITTIEAMWKKQDFPKLDENTKNQGGQVAVGDSEAVRAKDAAFFLHPHTSGAEREALEKILSEWVSADHDLRDQLGKTTLAQVIPRADKSAIDKFLTWFDKAKRPAVLARQIREAKNEELNKKLDAKIIEVANARYEQLVSTETTLPSVAELRIAIMEVEQAEGQVALLEKIILEDKAPDAFVDAAMETLVKVQKERSTPFFNRLVTSSKGLKRWVAVTRLIEVRGRPGVLQAVNALPLEQEGYLPKELEENSAYFCNFLKGEFEELKIADQLEPTIKQLLTTSRWPAQLLGVQCAELHKLANLKPEVTALVKERQGLPGWGDGSITLGQRAKEVSDAL
jgi:hypothetical protein